MRISRYTHCRTKRQSGPFSRYEDLGVKQVIHLVPMKNIDDVRQRLDTMAKMTFG